ncbi:MAG: glycosyltransferase family 2 protein [Acidobacteriota bacterium]
MLSTVQPLSVGLIIPALNEEASLPLVLAGLPRERLARVLVVDNGSRDHTAEVARASGAEVTSEPRRGYGRACLAGLRALAAQPPEIVVILDADYSDRPEELPRLLDPIQEGRADLVIGSRLMGEREPGALPPHVLWGNRLATGLIRLLHRVHFTDLGPFRAIRWEALRRLRMQDPNFGWNVEMQIKAIRLGLRCVEVPVSYRKRVGVSKISGTVRGTLQAGTKILFSVGKYSFCRL